MSDGFACPIGEYHGILQGMMNRNIALLVVCQAVLMTGSSLLVATSALVGGALADSPGWATIPLGLQFVGMTITAAPASLCMQRFGRRVVFVLGSTVGITGVLMATYAITTGDFLLFSAASVCFGVFNGIGQFFRFAAADAAGTLDKGRAISFVMAGGIVAGFLGPNLGAWTEVLMGARFAGSYLALGGFYLVALLAVSLLSIPKPPPVSAAGTGRPLALIAMQPKFVVAVLTAGIGYGVMNIIMVATPLAMHAHQLDFGHTAFVIQWHVVAMFLPSFFTGHLIHRFGVVAIIFVGVLLMLACIIVNFTGASIWHYWTALVLLGLGWNFMFIGGTTLLTDTHAETEKGKVQALNDVLVFTVVSVTALSSGAIFDTVGWLSLNFVTVPFLVGVVGSIVWLEISQKKLKVASSVSRG